MKTLVRTMLVLFLLGGAAALAHEGHEHHDEAEETYIDPQFLGFSGLKELVNIHPAAVHMPVGLFPAALLLYGLGITRKWRTGCAAGRACLYLAGAGTVLAVVTGLQAAGSFPHGERLHQMMETHEHLGWLILIAGGVLVIWSFFQKQQRPKGAYLFLVLLAAVTYLVAQTGDLGARMVYVEGAAVRTAMPHR